MPLTNDLANLAAEANGLFNGVTANSTAITAINVAGQVVNSTGISLATGNVSIAAGATLRYSNTAYITPEDNTLGARISAPGTITMWTGATPAERVRVDVSGNFGIGQTPTFYSANVRNVEAYIAGASGYTLVSAATASVKTEIASSEASLFGQVGTRTNHPLIFKTSDTERGRFDTLGRLLLPNQPVFHVTHSNSTLTTGTIVWGNSIFNVGSYYNTTNGRFTAPVAGTYFFRAHTLIQNASAGETRMAIYKNDAGYGGLRFITIKPANSWWSIICEGHVYMNANEWVTVQMEQNPGTLYNDQNYNSFTGHFVG